jgi:hypothetical protein
MSVKNAVIVSLTVADLEKIMMRESKLDDPKEVYSIAMEVLYSCEKFSGVRGTFITKDKSGHPGKA